MFKDDQVIFGLSINPSKEAIEKCFSGRYCRRHVTKLLDTLSPLWAQLKMYTCRLCPSYIRTDDNRCRPPCSRCDRIWSKSKMDNSLRYRVYTDTWRSLCRRADNPWSTHRHTGAVDKEWERTPGGPPCLYLVYTRTDDTHHHLYWIHGGRSWSTRKLDTSWPL